MKIAQQFRRTTVLSILYLIIGTSAISQTVPAQEKVERKERQFVLAALGIGELIAALTAAAGGTAAVAAGVGAAAAIKDAVDSSHSGSHSGGGSGGSSSGGSSPVDVAEVTAARIRAMTISQVQSKIQTLVDSSPQPGHGDECVAVGIDGQIHLGVCQSTCLQSERARCQVPQSTCLTGQCCIKESYKLGACVGSNSHAASTYGLCQRDCINSTQVEATTGDICDSCTVGYDCCLPKLHDTPALMG